MGNTKRARKLDAYRRALTHCEVERIIEEIKEGPCTDCGRFFPPECMDFDHGHTIKAFSLSKWARREHTPNEILDEIEKCQIVCANCHRTRTRWGLGAKTWR